MFRLPYKSFQNYKEAGMIFYFYFFYFYQVKPPNPGLQNILLVSVAPTSSTLLPLIPLPVPIAQNHLWAQLQWFPLISLLIRCLLWISSQSTADSLILSSISGVSFHPFL